MVEVAWDSSSNRTLHMRSRPMAVRRGESERTEAILFKDQTWQVRYMVNFPATDKLETSQDVIIIDMHHGFL